jgi:aminoacrylate peracid reductase
MLPIAPFVPGAAAAGFVFTAGTGAVDPEGNVVHIGDIEGQTRYTLNLIKDVVETGGGTMADIVFNSIFIKRWIDYDAMNNVYAEFFPVKPPPRYCIQVGLVLPDLLVEIQSVAYIGDSKNGGH